MSKKNAQQNIQEKASLVKKLRGEDNLDVKVLTYEAPDAFNKLKERLCFDFPRDKKSYRTTKSKKKQDICSETAFRRFTELRKARENFRCKLVKLICPPGQDQDFKSAPVSERKHILRYFYYLKHGVDTIHVAPIDNTILIRIHGLLSPKLKRWKGMLQVCTDEVREDFMLNMKKAIVDFALKDPNKVEVQEKEETSLMKTDFSAKDEAWRHRYIKARKVLKTNLHSVNPCMQEVQALWWKHYLEMRLISMKDLQAAGDAFELADFALSCKEHIESVLTSLKTHWIPTIQSYILQGGKKKMVPDSKDEKRMKHFYNCLACIMTFNLQTLCINSIVDYTDYLLDIGGANQGFVVNTNFVMDKLEFEPPFRHFKTQLLQQFSLMMEATSSLPRIETTLYQDIQFSSHCDLRPIIDKVYIEILMNKVEDLIEEQRIGPELALLDFDNYMSILNGEAQAVVTDFIERNPPHTFEEYCAEALIYLTQANEIPLQLESTIILGMFKMQRGDLVNALRAGALRMAHQILGKMTADYQQMVKEVGEDYTRIAERLLTPPVNTADLMDLYDYIEKVQERILAEQADRLKFIMKYITFLGDHTAFSSLEIKANNNTFHWYARMPGVLKESKSICDEKKLEFQEYLMESIKKFIDDLDVLEVKVNELQHWGDITEIEKYTTRTRRINEKLSQALAKIDQFNEEEIAFGWVTSQYPKRKKIYDEMLPFKKLYEAGSDYLDKQNNWLKSKVGSYDPEAIGNDVDFYYKIVYTLEQTFREVPHTHRLASDIRSEIEDFKRNMPIVKTLGNPGMKERHWELVSEIVGFPIVLDDELTLEKVIDFQLFDYIEKFETISGSATKENNLERALEKMMTEWNSLEFEILEYKDSGTYVLSGVDDIQQLLDDHIVKTQTMKNSPYIKPFEEIILDWEGKLTLLQEILDDWLRVQATWMYLEPIFSSPDIQQQIPEEGRRFGAVDKMWREVMKAAHHEPRVLDVIQIEKMLDRLKKSSNLLEIIQRGLNTYLEKKRLFFPRFYFLSNDELLEILSETKDPTRVQPHLKKCFEGIARLTFTEDFQVTHMKSSEGEVVLLTRVVDTAAARGQVERWLLDLEVSMKDSVHNSIALAYENYETIDRDAWALSWPAQSVQCVAMTYWTLEVTEAMLIGIEAMDVYLEKYNRQISKIVELVRRKLSLQNRTTLGALIVLDVHARDVLKHLIDCNVTQHNDFHWQSHMRYYWHLEEKEENKSMEIIAKMINAQLMYGYEYLGNTTRLVMTPLTDRCFRTLFGALQLHFGGAPEGPAGAGKTETTKDLAKAVAKQCVVFNSSYGLDHIALGKFFKGTASCGAWFCFDEFSRMNSEVLSVVAQQILSIQRGLNMGLVELLFEGTQIKLDPACAVFITMSPGYAGCCELPDNLKVLFRPVAMMVPDFALIAEIELYAFGYLSAKSLAVKIVTTYRLCYEQISSQSHFDFGLRAIKSVLRAAGVLKLRYPDELEDTLILRCIRENILPKFLEDDVLLVMGIIGDLFPGLPLPEFGLPELKMAIKDACAEMNLQANDFFVGKALQLYETVLVRHGLMLVGLPFAGKTKVYQVLAAALRLVSQKGKMKENPVEWTVINPKSITMGQLYGEFDPVSHEWSDGILAVSFRAFAVSTNDNRKWLIFDGPVDASWIENLNTVLDDNKKLCLMSGEIIQLAPTTNLIFEPMDLEAASPATVSRCGMIYLQPKGLGWKAILESWLTTLPPLLSDNQRALLRALFLRFVPPLMWLIETKAEQMYVTSRTNVIVSCCNLVDSFMDDYKDEKYMNIIDEKSIHSQLEGVFFFSAIWSLGATLETSGRPIFDQMFRSLLEKDFPETLRESLGYPKPIGKPEKNYTFTIPKQGTVFDYKYIKEGMGKWRPWQEDVLSAPPISRDTPPNQIIVTTLETVRYMHLFKLLVTHHKTIMMVGPTGTGKSSYIIEYLNKQVDPKMYNSLIMAFSAHTSANQTQDIIMAKLDKRRKGLYGPPIGCHCVVFVDDVSMPQAETYGAQPPVEVLRQALDQKMWYDRKLNVPTHLIDVQFICAMGRPMPGSKPLTPRFTRHFGLFCIDEFDDDTMKVIYNKIMLWHLDIRGFSKDFDPCIEEIVLATLDVYKTCKLNLLPTPTKSHYVFNLRDFSRVILGVLLSVPEVTEDLQSMKRLWIHECLRVFSDRLVDDRDRDWFTKCLRNATQNCLNENFDKLLSRLTDDEEQITATHLRSLIYCDFANPKPDSRFYMEVTNFEHLAKTADAYLIEFNNMTKRPMNLVLFRFAIEHVTRICRVLCQPRSHALLIGLEGSGRQSLTRLAAHINEFDLFQVEISRSYGDKEWRADLKTLLKKSGTTDQQMVFLFAESQIKEERFLEDVNNMLNSGEVPNIFSAEEKTEICEKMRGIDRQRDKSLQTDGSLTALYAYFVTIVREQLHISLAMSPVGSELRARIRRFPALVNYCTIDWFQEWPEDALQAVATSFLKGVELTNLERNTAMQLCQTFYTDAQQLSESLFLRLKRKTYVTPVSYLESIKTFKTLLDKRRNEIIEMEKRYLTGLSQIEVAVKSVNELQVVLEELQPKLETVAALVAKITAEVASQREDVSRVEAVVLIDQEAADKLAKEAQVIKDECDADLEEVMPMLNAALAALSTLTPQDFTFIKTMKSPPKVIKLVMEGICILKEIKPEKVPDSTGMNTNEDYWEASKKLLNHPKFLDSLLNFDKENVSSAAIKKLTTVLNDPLFVPEKMRTVSIAAEAMCKWVIAISKYDVIAKAVAPKKERLAAAEEAYNRAVAALDDKQVHFREIQLKLATLEDTLLDQQRAQEKLDEELEDCRKKLMRAEMLVSTLGGEKTNWSSMVEQLRETYNKLVGNMLIAAGVVVYLGPFTPSFRNHQIKKWVQDCSEGGIVCSLDYSLTSQLADPLTILEWNINGLPVDDFNVESAIIIRSGGQWPLIIDPQSQANRWIKNIEKINNLIVVRMTQSDVFRLIEKAVQSGQPVLLENVGEELDPILEPLLQKQIFKQAGTLCIKIGDAIVEYNKQFKLYISTKLPNPHYLPAVAARVTLVNFTLGKDGLESQLQDRAIAIEKADLQTAKSELMSQRAQHERALKDIETKMFVVLSTSENLFEDEEAVQTLNSSKLMTSEIMEKQKVAGVAEKDNDRARSEYLPISQNCSVLFSLIGELASINPMYQYSLGWFEGVFAASIENADKFDDMNERIAMMRKHFTYSLYTNICRGIYEKDKLVYSLLLTLAIMFAEDKIEQSHVLFLLAGGEPNHFEEISPDFLSPQAWAEINKLNQFNKYSGILAHIKSNPKAWEDYCNLPDPHNHSLPTPWDSKLTLFESLLVLRCVRRDMMVSGVQNLVASTLGRDFIEPPLFDLVASYGESLCCTPLLFLLTPGSDPMRTLLKFADDQGFGAARLFSLSMGQGQDSIAANIIEEAIKMGSWVVLQNCHLAQSWMPTLEKICEDLKPDSVHPDFRLWLTSYPAVHFPSYVLQNSVKIVDGPPQGLRANITRSLQSDPMNDPEWYEGHKQSSTLKKLLYALCFFHAVVQERRQFGPLGWNIQYEFNETDLRISILQLHMFLNEYDDVPFTTLRYLFGECNYGGRVTDDWDRRTLKTILCEYYNEDVLTVNKYAVDESGTYTIPSLKELSEFLLHTRSFPATTQTSVFGLHDNADITKRIRGAAELLDTALLTQDTMNTGAVDVSPEEQSIAIARDVLRRLPASVLSGPSHESFIKPTSPMFIVLTQEAARYDKLVNVIKASSRAVIGAVQGINVLNETTEEVLTSMVKGKVPALWMKSSYPSLKPLAAYIDDLIARLEFLQNWHEHGAPAVFWLSGFYFPQAFFTATQQIYARKHNISIDQIEFHYEVQTNTSLSSPPTDGVYINGIFMEAARWNREKAIVDECKPKVLYDSLPPVWLIPLKREHLPQGRFYDCPLYKTGGRKGVLSTTGHSTNYILVMVLPTIKEPKHWIMRGVALLTQLHY